MTLMYVSSHPFPILIILNKIQGAIGQVSFTLDLWTDGPLQSYLAMTAHWIAEADGALQLKAALIAFHHVRQKHTGKALARTVLHLLDRVGVTLKVSQLCSSCKRCTLIHSSWGTSLWTMHQIIQP